MNHINTTSDEKDSYVTSIISAVVKPHEMKRYEQWIEKINAAASESTDFFSVDVLKPKDHTQPECVVILKFNHYENLKIWLSSDECNRLTKEAQNYIIHMTDEQQSVGMEMWFSRSNNQRYYPKPKFYKQVLMGLMVVYPLSTVIGAILAPHLAAFTPHLQKFIIIAVMSCLMTWPVMPYLTRWLSNWLYPKPK